MRHFSGAAAGPPPDYNEAASWAVLPGHPSGAQKALPGLPLPAPADTMADVFYLYPTTYF